MTLTSRPGRSWDDGILRTAIMLLVFAGALWLGGTVYRAIIAFELFISGTLEFDPMILPPQEQTLYQLIFATSLVVLISYTITLISAVVVLWRSPLRIKEHGWLLMASLLVFIFIPVEIFTAYLDIHFFWLWDWTKEAMAAQGPQAFMDVQTELRKTISHRIGALSGLPVMAALCYITAALVVIWQPMRRKRKLEPTQETEQQ
jgi:hypothetical protein